MDEQGPEQTKQDALSVLVEVERRVASEVEAAEEQAARIVESARRDALARAAEVDDGITRDLESLRADIERTCEASIRSIEAGARAELERYREVDPETLRRLARWLVERVSGSSGGAASS